AVSNIKLRDDDAARDAVETLLTDFSEHKQIAKAVNKAADHYRWSGKYEKAKQLYQHVVDNWPQAEYAIWAQKSLAVSNMRLGDDPNAAAATEKLLADYSEHKQIANAVNMLAGECSMLKRYDKARELNQYVIDHRPEDKSAMQAQADLIKSYLALGNDPNAEAATDKLLADFNDNPLIAGAVWVTAQFCRDLKKYEKANRLYQHVVDKWPNSEHAILSQMGMSEVDVLYLIDSGNDTAAHQALDSLIADFNDHPALPKHLFVIGEQYYNVAFRFEKERRAAEGKENFLNAIVIWDRILKDLHPSPVTPETYLLVGICYDRIGNYRTAIKYYQVVLDDWPDYQHACSAQYKIGRCYQRLRDAGLLGRPEAEIKIRAAYEAVVKIYPDCSTANAARNWLNYNKKPAEGDQK
ncbi:MAG: tetratricopeptide repeat protein, partial [Phycisphaerae bacterium]|nr:tetratricopeptide repeat protein [Phycisphaerae bacterium]